MTNYYEQGRNDARLGIKDDTKFDPAFYVNLQDCTAYIAGHKSFSAPCKPILKVTENELNTRIMECKDPVVMAALIHCRRSLFGSEDYNGLYKVVFTEEELESAEKLCRNTSTCMAFDDVKYMGTDK